ncbi:MAG: type II toxin-antitoxin system HicA family toxin [Candidatus Eremiobacteraeota bacterium]|nr:type II toxin-antitoxin system HicA family toxin [Candidatus Eremiobacteraeota bacterium]
MKRKEFVRRLIKDGCVFQRSGANHDLYVNPANGRKQPVPRHTEIDNKLAKHIRKYLGLK